MNEEPQNLLNNSEMIAERNEKGQLLPGVVLNPAGKPKGTRHFSTLFKELLKEKVKIRDKNTGEITEMTMLRAMGIAMAQEAIKGNTKAFSAVADRLDGKPLNFLDITTDGEPLVNRANKKEIDKAVLEYLTGKRSLIIDVAKKDGELQDKM